MIPRWRQVVQKFLPENNRQYSRSESGVKMFAHGPFVEQQMSVMVCVCCNW
jgi:hypothetical protein